jgi:predicted RNA-binding Zn-ribbon protein involved in translation (DUF1610 family)
MAKIIKKELVGVHNESGENVILVEKPKAIGIPCPRCGADLKATSGKGRSGTDYTCVICGLNTTM